MLPLGPSPRTCGARHTRPMPTDPGSETTRLFFAIVPDDVARSRLDALAREAARAAGGRATLASTLHLTVVFVGNVRAAAVADVRAAGDAAAWPSFELAFDVLGSFARAGVAWAAPSRVPRELASVNRALVRALDDRGIRTDPRSFRPHLTLARRCTRVVEGTIEPPIAWPVDRVVLMSSRRLPDGPRYREVATWATG